jgi:phosphopantetheinyl transferase
MTRIYWIEQTQADWPEGDSWLTAPEKLQAESFQVPKPRTEWLLGRWTAKLAIAELLHLDPALETLALIELQKAPDGAPFVLIMDEPAPLAVSISHRAGSALCAVVSSGAAVGCDLEQIEPHSDAFLSDYFTREEQEFIDGCSAEDRWRATALLWSAKESVLKLLHAGLRLDTKSVSVRLNDSAGDAGDDAPNRWNAFRAEYVNGSMFRGWCRNSSTLVRTLVAFPPPMAPVRLGRPGIDTADTYNLPSGKIRPQQAC